MPPRLVIGVPNHIILRCALSFVMVVVAGATWLSRISGISPELITESPQV